MLTERLSPKVRRVRRALQEVRRDPFTRIPPFRAIVIKEDFLNQMKYIFVNALSSHEQKIVIGYLVLILHSCTLLNELHPSEAKWNSEIVLSVFCVSTVFLNLSFEFVSFALFPSNFDLRTLCFIFFVSSASCFVLQYSFSVLYAERKKRGLLLSRLRASELEPGSAQLFRNLK